MTEQLDTIEILGGKATIYRRVAGGSFHFFCRLKEEDKRFRQSLKTKSVAEATSKAEDLVVEILAKERQGIKVISSTFGGMVDEWHDHQLRRLGRKEIRHAKNVQDKFNWLSKHVAAHWGLDTKLSTLTQQNFDAYLDYRSETGVKLSTVVEEMKVIRCLVRDYGIKLGAGLVPEVEIRVPQEQRAKRFDTFTDAEWKQLKSALDPFMEPEDGRLYNRDWSLGNTKQRLHPRRIDQKLEEERRHQMRWLVLLLEASGARPHECCGGVESSLRWGDVRIESLRMDNGKYAVLAHLSIRTLTKTGRRTVPTYAGWLLGEIKNASKFQGPDDFVFAQQIGPNAGEPTDLDILRRYFRRFVLDEAKITRFQASFYSIRHSWITNRLRSGVPIALVAEAAGNSVAEIQKTYSKLVMDSPEISRQFWGRVSSNDLERQLLVVGGEPVSSKANQR